MADITVADRCPTPLAVCRRYAQSHALTVETVEIDFANTPLASKYDVAFLHNMLMHQPLERHTALLANLRQGLDPSGALILVNKLRPREWQADPPPPAHFAARVLDALSERGVALPENEPGFRRRLETFAQARRSWSDVVMDMDRQHVEACLAAAGYAIARRIDHDRRRAIPDRDGGKPLSTTTSIFIARPRKAG